MDDYDVDEFVTLVRDFDATTFDYVVTPNVDHLIRYGDDPAYRRLCEQAGYVLLDSRFLAHLLSLTGRVAPRVCPGSDLTTRLLEMVAPSDRIVLIGGEVAQARNLAGRFGLRDLCHYNPLMGFIRDPDATEQCLRFVEAQSPFRYCLLAVGSPQQEMLAYELKRRGSARGLALCVGASVNFLTGVERRAPVALQRLGLEWLYRLLQDPRRLAKRYLVRGPRIFVLLPRLALELRRVTAVDECGA